MRATLRAILIFLCGFLGASVWSSEPVVSVRVIPPSEPVRTGTLVHFAVELDISRPYHINSNQPLEDYLIPTTLEFEPLQDVKFGKIAFPAAEIKKLPVSDAPMAVYEGIVRITIEVTPAADIKAKDIVLKGRVRYQACDDRACLPPVRQPFSLRLTFGDSAQSQTDSNRITLSSGISGEGQGGGPSARIKRTEGSSSNNASSDFSDKSLLATLLLVFAGGLALNLTPCVYPMIPITVAYFGGQAKGKKGNLIIHSVLYTVGMAMTYSILGVAAALTGGFLGSALQYPSVLIGIAIIMVVLALSMFDVYELRMPAFLNRMAGSSQKGLIGTFFMGLTVGIVAAPCIGPFVLGLLTYVGNKGNAALGFALFFVLALGLGFPFLILGIFSGSIRRLPRSGSWMVWIRKIFGFILLAMAVFFLKTLFPNLLLYQLTIALIMLLAGIYMAWVDPTTTGGKAFPYVRNVVGITFFGVALYAAVSGLQAYIGSAVLKGVQTHSISQNSNGMEAIRWFPFSEERLVQASRETKPVFIDFYADWCAPCKELDTYTFAASEIIDISKEFVMLKVDLTSADDPQTEALRKRFQVRGVPTLVFLKPDSQEIPSLRGAGFESKEVFLPKMKQALQLSEGQKHPL